MGRPFHGTPLDLYLRRRAVHGVLLAGVMTNFAIEGTARAADELGYNVVLVEDACASLTSEVHEFALREIFPRLGVTSTCTEDVLRTLSFGCSLTRPGSGPEVQMAG